jgi:hypothetical protein
MNDQKQELREILEHITRSLEQHPDTRQRIIENTLRMAEGREEEVLRAYRLLMDMKNAPE